MPETNESTTAQATRSQPGLVRQGVCLEGNAGSCTERTRHGDACTAPDKKFFSDTTNGRGRGTPFLFSQAPDLRNSIPFFNSF